MVLMPTGINTDYLVMVSGGGTQLEIQVKWPEMLCDSHKLHEPFQKLIDTKKSSKNVDGKTQDFLTKLQSFKKHIITLERQMDQLETTAAIDLPKTVHAHVIDMNAIGKKDSGTRILYINLICECTDSNKQRGGDYLVI